MALLKGKKAMWIKLANPEKKYGKEDTQWSIILVVNDEESRKWVRGGLALKEKFLEIDGTEAPVIKLKKDTHWSKSGEDKTPVKVVDMFGQDVDPRIIGNGSVVNVQYTVRDWEFEGRKGKTPELAAVQIVELVEFKGSSSVPAGDEFDFMTQTETELKDDLDLADDVFE